MRVLCPGCGQHHPVLRVLDDGRDVETGRDVYQMAPLGACERAWVSETDLREAVVRFGREATLDELDDDPLEPPIG